MGDEIELTLGDGSSVWLLKAEIISYSAEGGGARIIVLNPDATSRAIEVRESFAELTDIMNAADSTSAPGDFME